MPISIEPNTATPSLLNSFLALIAEAPGTASTLTLCLLGYIYFSNPRKTSRDSSTIHPESSVLQSPNASAISTTSQLSTQTLNRLHSSLSSLPNTTYGYLSFAPLFNFVDQASQLATNLKETSQLTLRQIVNTYNKTMYALQMSSYPWVQDFNHHMWALYGTPYTPSFHEKLSHYIKLILPVRDYPTVDEQPAVITKNPYNFSKSLSALSLRWITAHPIHYANALTIAKTVTADQTNNEKNWHWLHLQNMLYEIQSMQNSHSEINIYRIFHLSFRWLQTLYLDDDNVPSEYKRQTALNTASIYAHLMNSTETFFQEEHPKLSPEMFEDTSNGLQLTIALTDLICDQIKSDNPLMNFETAIARTSKDLNMSLKMIDAYLTNHDETINHIIGQLIYFGIIYAIIIGFIGFFLLSTMMNPLISITIVSALIAIPVLTSLYVGLNPTLLNKSNLKKSERELIKSAREREITEIERDHELDSIINNVGSSVIYYENLVIKILYGLIFSSMATALVVIPLIFFSIHTLPFIAALITASVIGSGLFFFLKHKPVQSPATRIPLAHPKSTLAIQSASERSYSPKKYSALETIGLSSVLLLLSYFKDDPSNLLSWLSNPLVKRFIRYVAPIDPLASEAILMSLPLWRTLDQGHATAETHNALREIAQKVSEHLPRNSVVNRNMVAIADHIVQLHSLERPPSNLTDFFKAVARFSLPYIPKMIGGTNLIQENMLSYLQIAYPEQSSEFLYNISLRIQQFLVTQSTDQTQWFKELATGILAFYKNIHSQNDSHDKRWHYRRQWEDNLIIAAQRLLGQSQFDHTIHSDPIINIAQSILEISQDALYQKGNLSVKENQIRDLMIRYSIMIEDIKNTEDTQYQFVNHYRYCWQHIPKLYFPIIITLSITLLCLTPFGFSIPIVLSLMIGGVLLLPYISQNSHNFTRVSEKRFGNLAQTTCKADEDIQKSDDTFLAPLLSASLKSVSTIFKTARKNLRMLTSCTILIGLMALILIGLFIAHANPIGLASIGVLLCMVVLTNILYERYFVAPKFKHYEYIPPSIAQPVIKDQFFSSRNQHNLNSNTNPYTMDVCLKSN